MKTSPRFALFRNRNFGLLWTAGLISMTGEWLLRVALPIYIYQLSGSAVATATAVGIRVAIGMIGAPIAGALVDRWDRRRVMVFANVLLAASLLPLLLVDSPDRLWIAYVAIAAQAMLAVFILPAEHSMLPRLVPEMDLPAANGLNALNNNLARLIGPALGAIVAVTMGIEGAVLLDSAAILIAAGLAALITGTYRAEAAEDRHLIREIGQGLDAVRHSRVLLALFAVVMVTAIGEGIMGSLLAVFVIDALLGGETTIGLLMSAQAVGGIIGGLLTGVVARRFKPHHLFAGGLVLFGVLDLVIFNYPRWIQSANPAVVIILFVGIPAAIMTAAAFTMLQSAVADHLRARVFSVILVVESLGGLIGATLAGTLTDRYGVINVLTGQGAAYVIAALVFILVLGRRGTAPEPQPSRLQPEPISFGVS